jgi:hypothetical protein
VAALDLRKAEAIVRGRLVRAASPPALVGTPRATSSDMLVSALGSDGSRLVRNTALLYATSLQASMGRLPQILRTIGLLASPPSPSLLWLALTRRVVGGRNGSLFNRDDVHIIRSRSSALKACPPPPECLKEMCHPAMRREVLVQPRRCTHHTDLTPRH